MKKKTPLTDDDLNLFKEAISGTRKIRQDIVVHPKPRAGVTKIAPERLLKDQIDASFYFSDEYRPNLDMDGPARYLRENASPYELKKLRRGDYVPELFLDLHGLTQLQAKQEIGALIAAARRENTYCVCIMHGRGKHVLKQHTPLWLAQHPDVIAFHQAPKEWGGTAALLLLIEIAETARRE